MEEATRLLPSCPGSPAPRPGRMAGQHAPWSARPVGVWKMCRELPWELLAARQWPPVLTLLLERAPAWEVGDSGPWAWPTSGHLWAWCT